MVILVIMQILVGGLVLFVSFQTVVGYLESKGYEIGFVHFLSPKAFECLGIYRLMTKKELGKVGTAYYIFYFTLAFLVISFLISLSINK